MSQREKGLAHKKEIATIKMTKRTVVILDDDKERASFFCNLLADQAIPAFWCDPTRSKPCDHVIGPHDIILVTASSMFKYLVKSFLHLFKKRISPKNLIVVLITSDEYFLKELQAESLIDHGYLYASELSQAIDKINEISRKTAENTDSSKTNANSAGKVVKKATEKDTRKTEENKGNREKKAGEGQDNVTYSITNKLQGFEPSGIQIIIGQQRDIGFWAEVLLISNSPKSMFRKDQEKSICEVFFHSSKMAALEKALNHANTINRQRTEGSEKALPIELKDKTGRA